MFKKECALFPLDLVHRMNSNKCLLCFAGSFQAGSRSKVKSSVQRGLRSKLIETYPGFEPYIDEIMPKKASLEAVKLYVPT